MNYIHYIKDGSKSEVLNSELYLLYKRGLERESDPFYVLHNDLPLSGTDPVGEFYVAGKVVEPLFNGLVTLGKRIVPFIRGNYKGDHLGLVKNRLINGGAERIGNPSLPKEVLYTELPIMGTAADISSLWSEKGVHRLLTDSPAGGHSLGYSGYASDLEKITKLYNLHFPESVLAKRLNLHQKLASADTRNITLAHEFEHYTHYPAAPISNDVIDSSVLHKYFSDNNNTEIAARFAQIKNYFGLKEGEPVTKQMWEYAKRNYIKDTGYDNNMSEFFQLPIKDLLKFLDWGNKNALSVIPAVGTMLNENNKKVQ